MSKIRLIAIDLDDTLLKNDLIISDRAKLAIQQAVDKGVAVTLATGRMYRSALPYAVELGLDLPLITYQGALVKYADGREIHHLPIPLATAREIINYLLPYGYHVNIYIDDELYVHKDSPLGQHYANYVKVTVNPVEDLLTALTREPTKILILEKEKDLTKVVADLKENFKDMIEVTKSKSYFVEITHARATKGTALKKLAESIGINREQVMAIGDSLNDLDMIKYAGWGVAMDNALPEVKAAARYVTKSNEDDGVAEAIEKLVLTND